MRLPFSSSTLIASATLAGTLTITEPSGSTIAYRQFVREELDNYEVDHSIFSYLKSKGYFLHIISDGTTIEALEILTRLKIIHFFKIIVVSEDFNAEKPSPVLFNEFTMKNSIVAENAIVIGDNEIRDIQGAKSLGFKTVLVSQTKQESKANFLISNLSDLKTIL